MFFPFLIAFLLLLQPDKGGAVFILLMAALMVYVGGVPKRVYLVVLPFIFLVIYYILTSKGYVAERLSAWKDPFLDPEDSGYQIIQSPLVWLQKQKESDKKGEKQSPRKIFPSP